jgi:hypothetical protein
LAIVLSVMTGVVFGAFPSLQVLRPGLMNVLRQSGASDGGAIGKRRRLGLSARGTLVVVQIALSIVLLVGAALIMSSLARLARIESGYQSAGLLTMRIPLPMARYDTPAKRTAFFAELVSRVKAAPGVRDATIVSWLPRSAVLAIDPDQPVADIKMMDEILVQSDGQRHLAARLLGLLAGVALLLAVVGIYGVLAYSVVQRTQEIGIRRTLGADRDHILRLVLGQAVGLTFVGVVCGLAGAFAFTRLLATLLFEVSPTDPTVFVGVAALFVLVALVAGLIPAWRAVRIDPMTALRA